MSLTKDMPDDCCLIRAESIRVGDRVRFRMASADYTVEEVEVDRIGHVRHRAHNGWMTCSYHPGELLWITRRRELPPHTCKFCGAPSWLDPSEQDPPPDYCHESDHGEPEFDRNMALPPNDILEAAAKVANWFAVRNINEWKLGSIQSRRDGGA